MPPNKGEHPMDAPRTAKANPARRAIPGLTIRGVKTAVVEVPLNFPLGTSAAIVRAAPLLLVDLLTEEDVIGRTYLFCYRRSGAQAVAALLEDAVDVVRGQQAAPVTIGQVLGRRFALLGVTGLARMALAALDGAIWDALARAADLPLAVFLGGELRSVPAYNSSGLGLMASEAAADEAEVLLQRGFRAIKLRLGYSDLAGDLAVTRAVRARVPDSVEIFVDYNQALDLPEALRRGLALDRKAWRGWRSRSATTISPGIRASPASSLCRCSSARISMGPARWRRRCAPARATW
jgi:mandelate racemase